MRTSLVGGQFLDPSENKFTLEVLKKNPTGGLPKGIDPAKKELYLEDDKF